MISKSEIDRNGQEYMSMCVGCRVDNRGICDGEKVVLENNHKKNRFSIYAMQGAKYKKELQRGKKEETLVLPEFEKWLAEHGYVEDEYACREAREGN